MFRSMPEAIEYIFSTRRRLDGAPRGLDEDSRDTAPTRALLRAVGLAQPAFECVVVTGSRGKGSVVSILAKLLQALGHRVGMLTGPHLVHWNERIRVDGRMIPADDFRHILGGLQPGIDAIVDELDSSRYLSPQGIFLAIALRYFAEESVDFALLEVGRGGRFDDIAVVPHELSLFAPIMLEHTSLLGASLERIAWHKAGIITKDGSAISLPQSPEVRRALKAESAAKSATIEFLAESRMARWLEDTDAGQSLRLPPYGDLFVALPGRYQIENASLAIRAAEHLHKAECDAAFRDAIRLGLSRVKWLGRAQKMSDSPLTIVDGAITVASALSFVASVESRLRRPVVSIVGIPRDRDFRGVYSVMAAVSDALIITETDINPSTRFPAKAEALSAANAITRIAWHAPTLTEALELARLVTGADGTILIAASLMLVGECMLIWDIDTTQI